MTSRKVLTACIASIISSMAAAQQDPVASAPRPAPQIEEISVIGQYVPDEKRNTDAVSNVVDEQQFIRTGDSNIAESLKRVAGLSTVGGKFVYVRGLGERYSTTLLNGAVLPSPEPENRVVPMDLFPTAVLDSVLVQKTYAAQFPSEFGGGVLQLRTKKSTDEFFWNVSSSLGYRADVTFEDGFTMPGGDRDWLGYDDGYRQPSDPLAIARASGDELRRYSAFTGKGYTDAELQEIGRAFTNEYNLRTDEIRPDINFSTALGNYHELGSSGMQLNYLAAIDYSNAWDTNQIERNKYNVSSGSVLDIADDMDYVGTENSIDLSGIFTAGLDFNSNHNVRLTSVLLRKTDDRAAEIVGDLARENRVRLTEIEWIERELFSNQIQGDHYFPDYNELVVNWRYSHVKAERDAPDTRLYRYDLTSRGYEFSSRSDGNFRNYSILDDTADEYGVDFTMVFYGPFDSVITPQAGYVHAAKDRESEIRRYGFQFAGPISANRTLLQQPLETILAADNISREGFEIREITRPTDNYLADNELEAFYLQSEFNFDDRFRLTVGARQESFTQNVNTFDLFRPGVEINTRQKSRDLLPALSATFIHYDHQFRLAYSETVSRPDFRELSPAGFTNNVTGYEVVGNPDLKIASIKNYDFRWEWYFAFSDYMSLGVFYKEFTNPIEATVLAGAEEKRTYINAAGAENQGIEYEIYKRLDFDFLPSWAEDFYVQGNVSYIDSEVSIGPEQRGVLTSTSRPLQGQSDWLFNAQLGYEPISGTTATLLYHYFGERITEVGIEGAPDLVEEPFGELNFIFIRDLNDHWKVTFKAKNLLDERSEITQGGLLATGYELGREFSLKIDYNF